MSMLQSLLLELQKQVPQAKVARKENSFLMKVAGRILALVGNPTFMSEFITTIGYTSYYPGELLDDQKNDFSNVAVLVHEGVHMVDTKMNPLFDFLYMIPQAFAALSLLALFAIWFSKLWLLALLALGLLAPLPAYWRMHYELRGYTMSMAFTYWWYGKFNPEEIADAMHEFTSGNYYWMWPFKVDMGKRIAQAQASITNGDVLREAWFKRVFDWIAIQKKSVA